MQQKTEARESVNDSRSINGARNAFVAFLVSVFSLLLAFVSRTVFIRYLSTEYLGLNGLFSSILGYLALSEIGIGNAVSYAMYKPIKNNDVEKIKSYMHEYKIMYSVVGSVIFIFGLISTACLPFFIKDVPDDMAYIRLCFFVYILNQVLSYFFSYKRTLIICCQKEYILNIAMAVFRLFTFICQVITLVTFGSYLVYLSVGCVFSILDNLYAAHKADSMYPYIREKNIVWISKEEKTDLWKNIKAIFFHKIGGTFAYSTDNIIISKFIGLIQIGIYSNYTLIVTTLNGLVQKLFVSLTSSLGNLMASGEKDHSKKVFYRVLFVNVWAYGFCSICLYCMLQPFIELWLGKAFLLDDYVVALAVFNFYLGGIRTTLLVFKDASGVFTQDKYKALIEGVANIILSVVLVIKFGISGVILGTIISLLLICFWFEALVFFKANYNEGIGTYLFVQIKYFVFNLMLLLLCFGMCEGVESMFAVNALFARLVIRIIICLVVPNILYILVYRNSDELKYIWGIVRSVLTKLGIVKERSR